jgi:hypothetical protein
VLVEDIGLNHPRVDELLGKVLPCRMLHSYLGRLQVVIPWANLLSRRTAITIENLRLTLEIDESL